MQTDKLNRISIKTEYIKLDAFLKFTGAAGTGGEAKHLIGEGKISVNGEPCLMRGKKLVAGDIVGLESDYYLITDED